MIRKVKLSDSRYISEIYNHYVNNTVVTFEEELVLENNMVARVEMISSEFPFGVYEEDGKIIGYTYANKWKARSAYRFSVETTVYLHPDFKHRGVGTKLYKWLLVQLKEIGIHSAFGGIALPNEASVKLHEKMGFEKVAHMKEVGYKFDQWIDVGYWQYIFE